MNRKIIGLVAVVAVCVAAVAFYYFFSVSDFRKKLGLETGSIDAEKMIEVPQYVPIETGKFNLDHQTDMGNPDAVVLTRSLSQLPDDIMSHPLLKEVLSEDFLFYYESNEARLSLEGAVRRILYEYRQDLFDRILLRFLNSPAEIALWKGHDGRLKHMIMVTPKTVFSNLAELAVEIAAKDDHFSLYKTIDRDNGQQIPIHKLSYDNGRQLYIASTSSNHYFFTSSDFFEEDEILTEEQLKSILTQEFDEGVFSNQFGLRGIVGKHSLLFSFQYLSFGYQKLFPYLKTLGFYFDGKQWETWVDTQAPSKSNRDANSQAYLKSNMLWSAIPGKPAFCSALPVEPDRVTPYINRLTSEDKNGEVVLKKIRSATAVCWYMKSDIFTPLIVVHTDDLIGQKSYLMHLFDSFINYGRNVPPISSDKGYVFKREIDDYSGESHIVSLGYLDHYLFMSPDGQLVEDTWDTISKKVSSVKDLLSAEKQNICLVISPKQLGELFKEAVTNTLRTYDERVFMESVSSHLFPVFDKMGTTSYQMLTLSMPEGKTTSGTRWEKLEWTTY